MSEPMLRDEEALLDASVEGDLRAFAALYERYRPRLLRRVTRQLGDAAAAEDVVQDAFLRAFANIGSFDRTRQVWPWLATIAQRMAIDVLRSRKRTADMPLVVDADGDDRVIVLPDTGADLTFDEVCARATNARLIRALGTLPARQQRTLLLHALEGWEYADIADAEATTVSSIKSLLFRARTRLREAYEGIGELGLVAGPLGLLRALRDRARRVAGTAPADGAMHAAFANIGTGLAAVALLLGSGPVRAPEPAWDAARAAEVRVERAAEGTGRATPSGRAAHGGAAREAGVLESVLDPNRDVRRPEDASLHAITPGHRGEVYATGTARCRATLCPSVLFRSDDGGASWRRLPAHGFDATRVLPAPDGRLFAMGRQGLQVSEDDGRTFRLAVPASSGLVIGSAAISPRFGRGDPRILIGAQSLMQYRDDLEAIEPARATALPGPLEPAFGRDGIVWAGGRVADPVSRMIVPAVFECDGAVCVSHALAGYPEPPRVRVAGGRVHAFTSTGVWAFSGHAFEPVAGPWGDAIVNEVVATGDAVFVATSARAGGTGEPGLWVFEADAWRLLNRRGVVSLSAFAGRLFAGLDGDGIACSADRGGTWSARCPA